MRVILPAFVSLMVIAYAVEAQEPSGSLWAMKRLSLLTQQRVHQELKLNDEQTEKLLEGRRELFAGMANLGQQDREKDAAKLRADHDKIIEELLDPQQRKRLDQITYQELGLYTAIGSGELRSKLDITDDQLLKLRDVGESVSKEMRVLIQERISEERSEKLRAITRKADEAVLKMLTPSQKAIWDQLTGEPFQATPEKKVID